MPSACKRFQPVRDVDDVVEKFTSAPRVPGANLPQRSVIVGGCRRHHHHRHHIRARRCRRDRLSRRRRHQVNLPPAGRSGATRRPVQEGRQNLHQTDLRRHNGGIAGLIPGTQHREEQTDKCLSLAAIAPIVFADLFPPLAVGKRCQIAAQEQKRGAAVARRIFTLSASARPNGVGYRFCLATGQLEVAGRGPPQFPVDGRPPPKGKLSSTRPGRAGIVHAS